MVQRLLPILYITAGSEASLILFQVNGSSGSDLDGIIEVFGGEAGLIIANPNGISCNGCGFINTNRVDLVTGTANFSGDDLTGFSINDTSKLNVSGDGFVSDAVADELNLVSRYLRIHAQAKANTTLRLLAGNDTYDHTTNIITSNTTDAAIHSISFNTSGYLEANYIELISTEISSSHGILNAGGDISANRLKLDSNGLFRNQNDGTNDGSINISGLLEVITADRFINNANITADTLTITTDAFFNNHNDSDQLGKIFVTDTFSLSTPSASYTNTGAVTTDSLNLTIGGDFTYESTTLNNFSFNNLAITATNSAFMNKSDLVVFDTLKITAGTHFSNSSTISTNSFIVTTGTYFDISGMINTNIFIVTAGGTFANQGGMISANSFIVTAGDAFRNWLGSTISADNFNVTTAKSFSNVEATISADNFTATTAENFSNERASKIIADNFTVTTAENFSNESASTISADNFTVTTTGDFNHRSSIINAGSFNVTTNGFYNRDDSTINAGSINATTNVFCNILDSIINTSSFTVVTDHFCNTSDSTIDADSFNVITNEFFNTSTVGDGNIIVNTFTLSVAGDFDYAANFLNQGTITADNLNFTARNGVFTNNATIELAAGSLGITANSFTNTGIVSADKLNLSIAGDLDYSSDFLNNGAIIFNSLNLNVNGDFSYDDTSNDFFWGINNNLTVSGDASITTNNYNQSGTIDVGGALTINVESDFDYVVILMELLILIASISM